MTAWARVAVVLALSLLPALGAAAEEAGRPIVYDVTVAGLERYQDADLRRMTPATVIHHVDGDTFEVAIADPPWGMRGAERVRFLGIDTPELDEPLGAEALDHVHRRAGSGPVYLAFDFRRRDRFDRLLAFVYLPDNTLLNAELIEQGLATVYRDDDLMYFLDEFAQLEQQARDGCRGMWHDDCGRMGIVIDTIRNNSRNEHVVLRNAGSDPVDISGWRLCDDDGDVIMIPMGTSLAPGETLAVCSGTGCVGSRERFLYPLTANIWGNPGDVGCLKDRSGNLIDSFMYGNQAGDSCLS